jgi:hypothetical protein
VLLRLFFVSIVSLLLSQIAMRWGTAQTLPSQTSSPTQTPMQSPDGSPSPECLTRQQAGEELEAILTPEQLETAATLKKQGASRQDVSAQLKLTREQKKQIRALRKRQCKKTSQSEDSSASPTATPTPTVPARTPSPRSTTPAVTPTPSPTN